MTKIINIGKIICTIKKFGDKNNKIPKQNFFNEIIKDPQFDEGQCQISSYKKHVKICEELGLIIQDDTDLILTMSGVDYFETIPTSNYYKIINEKTIELKNNLIKKILEKTKYIENELGDSIIDVQIKNGEPVFVIVLERIKEINKKIFNLLKDLELIKFVNDQFEVSPKIISKIPKIRKTYVSEEELYEILQKQREVGQAAEELTVKYERERLRGLGVKEDIVDRITRKSKSNSSAGYDISSFDGVNIQGKYDRFIEVKATTSNYPVFYWSENERSVAEKYGDKYFIYLWINFGKTDQCLVSKIKNPFHELVEEKYDKITPITTWRVTWMK